VINKELAGCLEFHVACDHRVRCSLIVLAVILTKFQSTLVQAFVCLSSSRSVLVFRRLSQHTERGVTRTCREGAFRDGSGTAGVFPSWVGGSVFKSAMVGWSPRIPCDAAFGWVSVPDLQLGAGPSPPALLAGQHTACMWVLASVPPKPACVQP